MSSEAEPIIATGMPLGLFYASTYEVKLIQLARGETLLFYTDGVTEAETARILGTDMSALRTLLLGRAIFGQKNSLRHAAMVCQRSLRARTYPMILHC